MNTGFQVSIRTLLATALLLIAALAVLFPAGVNAAATYFRIVNDAGNTELKETITPSEARRGYEIVSEHGRVLEIIEPELTPDQFAALSEAEQKARLEMEAKEREAQYNLSLLLKYSSIDDLEAERRRKLGEFDINISILKGNLTVLRENAERQRARAAAIERDGRTAPQKLQEHILEIEAEMNETLAAIKARESEKSAVGKHYDEDAVRLDQLLAKTR